MKIAFLGGGGNMGSALIRGLLASGTATHEGIHLVSSTRESTVRDANRLGVVAASSAAEAVSGAEVVFVCVKPAKVLALVSELSGSLEGRLLVSVAAGITAADLAKAAGQGCRVIRAMPNTAVRLRNGVTAIALHPSATEEDRLLAINLFSSVGTPVEIPEEQMNIATAISGSGPAFALLMMEAMVTEGVRRGLDDSTARLFASGAFSAASGLVASSDSSPAKLREEITSPGGTTAAGLSVLTEHGFAGIVETAVSAAAERAAEMSGKSR